MASSSRTAEPTEIALGIPVEVLTITLTKSRQSTVGLTLQGIDKPQVLNIANPETTELRIGDICASVNGKSTTGAIKTAAKIKKKGGNIELEIWRPIPRRRPGGATLVA